MNIRDISGLAHDVNIGGQRTAKRWIAGLVATVHETNSSHFTGIFGLKRKMPTRWVPKFFWITVKKMCQNNHEWLCLCPFEVDKGDSFFRYMMMGERCVYSVVRIASHRYHHRDGAPCDWPSLNHRYDLSNVAPCDWSCRCYNSSNGRSERRSVCRFEFKLLTKFWYHFSSPFIHFKTTFRLPT